MKKTGNLKRLFIFNGLLLVVAFAIIQYSVIMHAEEPAEQEAVIQKQVSSQFSSRLIRYDDPRPFPNLAFKTAFDKMMVIDDLKGQWVVLNLWATWCPPCLVEMPSLQKMQDEYEKDGVRVVAIALDRNMNGEQLREFNTQHQFGPIAAYYGYYPDIKSRVEIKGLPTTYILSPSGQAIAQYQGDADWTSEEARAFITSLLVPAQQ